MAFTKIIIISLFAAVQAGYAGNNNDRQKHFQMPQLFYPIPPQPPFLPQFGHIRMPIPPTTPTLPTFPGFGHMFMPTPPFLPFSPSEVKVMTPEEIANTQPGTNQHFSGAAVRSHSGFTTDKDGNVVRTHGTTVLTNNDGEVQKIEVGDNPPDINEPIVIPSFSKFDFDMPEMPEFKMPVFEPIKMPEFKPIKMPEFKPIKMHKFKPIEPIDEEKIRNYIPKDGETFTAYSSKSYSSSSDNNGQKSSTSGGSIVTNIDGQVEEQISHSGTADKDASKKRGEE